MDEPMMLRQKTPVFEIIAGDLYRYFGQTGFRRFVKAFVRIPGFRFSVFLRLSAEYMGRAGLHARLAYVGLRLIREHYGLKYGYQIPEDAVIGTGLYLGHFGAVIINPAARIGENVNLAPGVVIGQINRGPRLGSPRIGNRVWIGANAVLVGAISIGNDVLIGPGAYVNSDIPDNSVVIGNPGRIVSCGGTAGYIQHCYVGSAASVCTTQKIERRTD